MVEILILTLLIKFFSLILVEVGVFVGVLYTFFLNLLKFNVTSKEMTIVLSIVTVILNLSYLFYLAAPFEKYPSRMWTCKLGF